MLSEIESKTHTKEGIKEAAAEKMINQLADSLNNQENINNDKNTNEIRKDVAKNLSERLAVVIPKIIKEEIKLTLSKNALLKQFSNAFDKHKKRLDILKDLKEDSENLINALIMDNRSITKNSSECQELIYLNLKCEEMSKYYELVFQERESTKDTLEALLK